MSGNPSTSTLVEEVSELSELNLEDEESEDKLPEPYDVFLDSACIFSGITHKNLESFLQKLAAIYTDSQREEVIRLVLEDLLNASSSGLVKKVLVGISNLLETCFCETEGLNTSKRVVELERKFVEHRSSGIMYDAVKRSWDIIIFTTAAAANEPGLCEASVEILQQVLQHFWSQWKQLGERKTRSGSKRMRPNFTNRLPRRNRIRCYQGPRRLGNKTGQICYFEG